MYKLTKAALLINTLLSASVLAQAIEGQVINNKGKESAVVSVEIEGK